MTSRVSNIVSARQLRAARVLAGLTQRQLSIEAGFNSRACRYWEARRDNPPTSVPQSLGAIEAALRRHGVEVFAAPTANPRTLSKTAPTIKTVYFLLSGVVSVVVDLAAGEMIEAAMIGRDSLFGGSFIYVKFS